MSIENNVTLLNYAYNGAHINSSLTYNPPPKVVPDTRTQINTYIEEVTSYLDSSPEPQEVHSNILHVLWIGINPILYHWLRINIDVSHEETMNDVQPEIDQEVEALVQQLSDLAQSSSRLKTLNFTPQYIVLNVPPLHKTVFGRKAAETLSGSDSRLMSRYLGILLSMIEYFNKRLVESIGALKSSGNQINVKIKIFDAMSFWNQVQSKPYEYGLHNLTACYPVTSQPPCKQPSAYEYWDSLHPTTSFHSLLSDEILRFL
ncbi:hypothetical protein BY996DRAFT_2565792 [Phakopsora pachyrhizi]|uniref:Expressed protein n=1 Tax=Phakopsora pachyrhizi TaxID=170000 RepID=A0AAV0AN28_PHAPC|nr:hypothetical protein BY996DRAFT_2565792 [Phakopsora pachyrhizi]CAH7669511.1 expressed protein [Phakopsora pachyrhizi]